MEPAPHAGTMDETRRNLCLKFPTLGPLLIQEPDTKTWQPISTSMNPDTREWEPAKRGWSPIITLPWSAMKTIALFLTPETKGSQRVPVMWVLHSAFKDLCRGGRQWALRNPGSLKVLRRSVLHALDYGAGVYEMDLSGQYLATYMVDTLRLCTLDAKVADPVEVIAQDAGLVISKHSAPELKDGVVFSGPRDFLEFFDECMVLILAADNFLGKQVTVEVVTCVLDAWRKMNMQHLVDTHGLVVTFRRTMGLVSARALSWVLLALRDIGFQTPLNLLEAIVSEGSTWLQEPRDLDTVAGLLNPWVIFERAGFPLFRDAVTCRFGHTHDLFGEPHPRVDVKYHALLDSVAAWGVITKDLRLAGTAVTAYLWCTRDYGLNHITEMVKLRTKLTAICMAMNAIPDSWWHKKPCDACLLQDLKDFGVNTDKVGVQRTLQSTFLEAPAPVPTPQMRFGQGWSDTALRVACVEALAALRAGNPAHVERALLAIGYAFGPCNSETAMNAIHGDTTRWFVTKALEGKHVGAIKFLDSCVCPDSETLFCAIGTQLLGLWDRQDPWKEVMKYVSLRTGSEMVSKPPEWANYGFLNRMVKPKGVPSVLTLLDDTSLFFLLAYFPVIKKDKGLWKGANTALFIKTISVLSDRCGFEAEIKEVVELGPEIEQDALVLWKEDARAKAALRLKKDSPGKPATISRGRTSLIVATRSAASIVFTGDVQGESGLLKVTKELFGEIFATRIFSEFAGEQLHALTDVFMKYEATPGKGVVNWTAFDEGTDPTLFYRAGMLMEIISTKFLNPAAFLALLHIFQRWVFRVAPPSESNLHVAIKDIATAISWRSYGTGSANQVDDWFIHKEVLCVMHPLTVATLHHHDTSDIVLEGIMSKWSYCAVVVALSLAADTASSPPLAFSGEPKSWASNSQVYFVSWCAAALWPMSPWAKVYLEGTKPNPRFVREYLVAITSASDPWKRWPVAGPCACSPVWTPPGGSIESSSNFFRLKEVLLPLQYSSYTPVSKGAGAGASSTEVEDRGVDTPCKRQRFSNAEEVD